MTVHGHIVTKALGRQVLYEITERAARYGGDNDIFKSSQRIPMAPGTGTSPHAGGNGQTNTPGIISRGIFVGVGVEWGYAGIDNQGVCNAASVIDKIYCGIYDNQT